MKYLRKNAKKVITVVVLAMIALFLLGYNLTKDKNIEPIEVGIRPN